MIKRLIVLFVMFFGIAALISLTTISEIDDAYAVTCFKTGGRISGMNKICYYNCLGSEAAITISSAELCPLSIEN